MIILTPENYEKMLVGIYNIGKKKKYQLLQKFCRRYRLDYQRTKQDFEHVIIQQQHSTTTSESSGGEGPASAKQ